MQLNVAAYPDICRPGHLVDEKWYESISRAPGRKEETQQHDCFQITGMIQERWLATTASSIWVFFTLSVVSRSREAYTRPQLDTRRLLLLRQNNLSVKRIHRMHTSTIQIINLSWCVRRRPSPPQHSSTAFPRHAGPPDHTRLHTNPPTHAQHHPVISTHRGDYPGGGRVTLRRATIRPADKASTAS